MTLSEKLRQSDKLQHDIEQHGLLGKDILQKINYKFRLEWNYYSNRMEGNTLSIEETKNVMIGNINVHDKPLKDVFEMKGHDEAVESIIKMGKGEQNITETRIKELHKMIMYEENDTEKKKIGRWKDQPNYIYNHKNERFDFTTPEEVPIKMHELINWLNAEKEKIKRGEKNALHPVVLAFQFHVKYLTIHPFYDGNGRTARILMNLILISNGYPPIYVKDKEKKTYYRYLGDVQAYGADQELLFGHLADYLIRSLNIVSDAIAGKEIDEPDDLDKKIFLLEKDLMLVDPNEEVKLHFNKEVFIKIVNTWLIDSMDAAIPVVQKFNKFFSGTNHHINLTSGMANVSFVDEPASEIITKFTTACNTNEAHFSEHNLEFNLYTNYGTFKKGGLNAFGCNYGYRIKFEHTKYEVYVDKFTEKPNVKDQVKLYEKLLHQPLTQIEVDTIARHLGDTIYQHIDFYTKEKGLRK